MANQIIRAKYVADNGDEFVVGIDSEVAADTGTTDPAASLVGYAAAPIGLNPLPRQMKPRRGVFFNAAGKRREVIILSPTAPLWTGDQAVLTLEDSDGASSEYTLDAKKGEQVRKRRKVAAV